MERTHLQRSGRPQRDIHKDGAAPPRHCQRSDQESPAAACIHETSRLRAASEAQNGRRTAVKVPDTKSGTRSCVHPGLRAAAA